MPLHTTTDEENFASVRSAIHKPQNGKQVVGLVDPSESLLLCKTILFEFFFAGFSFPKCLSLLRGLNSALPCGGGAVAPASPLLPVGEGCLLLQNPGGGFEGTTDTSWMN